jgi:glucokinase
MQIIGIDIGGTNIKGVLCTTNGQILFTHSIDSYDQNDWLDGVKVVKTVLQTKSIKEINFVGISAPGLAKEDNRGILWMHNSRVNGIESVNWSELLECEAFIINDGHAALMAEAKFGQLSDVDNGVVITLGTGVGGGIMVNRELYQGYLGRAGHIGHISTNAHVDELSIANSPGSLEYAIGNYSVSRRSFMKYNTTKDLIDDYMKGDQFATWLWLESVRKLSIGLSSLINIISPEKIVLSGGIVHAGDCLLNPLQQFMSIYEFNPVNQKTPIVLSNYKDHTGAFGAAIFAYEKTKSEQFAIVKL